MQDASRFFLMAITLVKEDGSSLVNANTYAVAADGDAYADSRLRSTDWTSATTGDKEKALAMATRVIDQEFVFNGFKTSQQQALQWPRAECPDPDFHPSSHTYRRFGVGNWLPSDEVPRLVVDVTCEMAIQLLKAERTGDAQGAGIKKVDIAESIMVEFDGPGSQPLIVTRDVINALAKYGQPVGRPMNVKLKRV